MIKSGIGVFVVDKYDEISVPLIHEKNKIQEVIIAHRKYVRLHYFFKY